MWSPKKEENRFFQTDVQPHPRPIQSVALRWGLDICSSEAPQSVTVLGQGPETLPPAWVGCAQPSSFLAGGYLGLKDIKPWGHI